ncbi:uncharacterized protein EI90DRAFT_3070545 [Cantharellus anzutake]|uniref:uncharacterized protein n=1 Tax=Cantharellus anzutake TaxID=1750568 RepID=UPI0019070321|nr:uncharacterized protein EI90DRAFT_3070545 [Cantharellus anzutake]KAF8326343.1 hypothetical protein EI90DRAFT_3070545 [Cantharellus anzutake]
MCHLRFVWHKFICGHKFIAPGTPEEGEKIDCGSNRCRISVNHPQWCQNPQCREGGCWSYKTQPVHITAKRSEYPCDYCQQAA